MKPLPYLLAVLFSIMATNAIAQQPKEQLTDNDSGMIYFMSANRDTGIDQLYRKKVKYDEMIHGELVIPASEKPIPAMVIMHGSGGIDASATRAWARLFNEMGIATFIVDSFTDRKIFNGTGSDQTRVSYTTSGIDGLRALQLLATHPKIDLRRIGQIGFSRGGVATQESAFERFRASVIDGDLKFAVHIPLYGGCTQYGKTTGVPILHLIGEKDGFTQMRFCERVNELIKQRGGNIRLVIYPNALHGFDNEGFLSKWIPTYQVWKDCEYTANMDNLTYSIPGKPLATLSDVVAYRKSCMTYGFQHGGDSSAAANARKEVKELVTKVFGLNL